MALKRIFFNFSDIPDFLSILREIIFAFSEIAFFRTFFAQNIRRDLLSDVPRKNQGSRLQYMLTMK